MNKRVDWLDPVKALALLGILFNHLVEEFTAGPWFTNPSADFRRYWPEGPTAPLVWLGWLGDSGPGVFILLSGFALTLSAPRPPLELYRRRLARIFPLYWTMHLVLFAFARPPLGKITILSLLGLRFTPESFFYFSPSWWFVWLILQLYFVYPFLRAALDRFGVKKFLAATVIITFVARGVLLYLHPNPIYCWLTGMCFLTRLAEFTVGMALAVKWPSRNIARWSAPIYLAGLAGSFTWWGAIASNLLVTIGLTGLLYCLVQLRPSRALTWVGVHSFAIFLFHQPPLKWAAERGFVAAVVALVLSIPAAVLVERAVERGLPLRTLAIAGAATTLVVLGAEFALRRFHPIEVETWGELPALTTHPTRVYGLKPSATTHLRYGDYDYVIRTNSLGLPGPEPRPRDAVSLRILAVGDAFTMPEALGWEDGWPAQLEKILGGRVEVINAGVTGYGPVEESAQLAELLPQLRPDVVAWEFFINEFEEASIRPRDRLEEIGLARAGLRQIVADTQLAGHLAWLEHRRRGEVDRNRLLDRFYRRDFYTPARVAAVGARIAEIRELCKNAGARLTIYFVPGAAAVEGTPRPGLEYDLPLTFLRQVAGDVPVVDLTPHLRTNHYLQRSWHWNRDGHRAAAEAIAATLRP